MISVCITEFKNPALTKQCINSLKLASYKDIEILIRSNAEKNIGLGASTNILVKQAKGEYIFLLNDDAIVKMDIFENLLKARADIVGCRMMDYSGRYKIDSMISLDRFGCPAGTTGLPFYPDGAIFMKKSVFEELGGYDEKIFAYGEDRDLCWRAFLAGYSVGINFGAVFYHNSRSAVGDTTYLRRYHSERNVIRMMLKNYSLKSLLVILPQYLFWSILELILILFTKPSAIIKSYIPAYLWNVKNLPIKERKQIIRRVKDKDIPFSKVIGKLYVLKTKGVPQWKK